MTASSIADLPHPRETQVLFGHEGAERQLLDGFRTGRPHHALLLTGPRGIGKATLAYRLARFVLSGERGGLFGDTPDTLALDPEHPVAHQVAAGAYPDLVALHGEGEGARASGAILVDDIRRVTHFFATTAAGAGWRVAIVDAAEDMNAAAANALLKTLEEPPQRGMIILVSHAPGRLARTIRSRCMQVALSPLPAGALDRAAHAALGRPVAEAEDLATIAVLAEGSLRRSIELADQGGLAVLADLRRVVADLPTIDTGAAYAFADRFAGQRAREDFALAVDLILLWLAGSIRLTASGGGAGEGVFARLPGRLARWAEVWEKTSRAAALADTYNLDRKHVIFSAFTDFAEAAQA